MANNRYLNSIACLVWLLLMSAQAGAVLISSGARVAPSPAVPGSGLAGAYWDAGSFGSITDAIAFADGNAPTATFVSTRVDYPNGDVNDVFDGTSLGSYLGVDAATLSGAAANTIGTSIFRFTGFINIETGFDMVTGNSTIDIVTTVGSDDGMRLTVGGQQIVQFSTPRAFGLTSGMMSFESAGLYAVDLIYYENGGVTGIEWLHDSTGLGGATNDGQFLVPASVLYQSASNGGGNVPVPFTLALVLVGFLGMGVGRAQRS